MKNYGNSFITLAPGLIGCRTSRRMLPFVVSEVKVDLPAVVEDVDLAVLVWREGAGVDVQVGVDLAAAASSNSFSASP